ncbi:MAG: hypothetical protein E7559_03510 [Ruminococcaceae bacterium]|nr:hypothetical protein [Oscillospiraceae bacterium]
MLKIDNLNDMFDFNGNDELDFGERLLRDEFFFGPGHSSAAPSLHDDYGLDDDDDFDGDDAFDF